MRGQEDGVDEADGRLTIVDGIMQELLDLRLRMSDEGSVDILYAYKLLCKVLESLQRYDEFLVHRCTVAEIRRNLAIHTDLRCDGCGMDSIRGERHHCDECSNFDFCGECYRSGKELLDHRSSHPMSLDSATEDAEWQVSRVLKKMAVATPNESTTTDNGHGPNKQKSQ